MKLIDVEYTFDDSKLIFISQLTAGDSTFELVKDLASVFKTRIELRQIGVRDEAQNARWVRTLRTHHVVQLFSGILNQYRSNGEGAESIA